MNVWIDSFVCGVWWKGLVREYCYGLGSGFWMDWGVDSGWENIAVDKIANAFYLRLPSVNGRWGSHGMWGVKVLYSKCDDRYHSGRCFYGCAVASWSHGVMFLWDQESLLWVLRVLVRIRFLVWDPITQDVQTLKEEISSRRTDKIVRCKVFLFAKLEYPSITQT